MKPKIIVFLAFVLISQIFTNTLSAHLEEELPALKINGQNTTPYKIPLNSSFFEIPEDQGPQNYEVNQKLEFEINPEALQIPQEVLAKSNFDWDFGDGQKGQGLKNTHIYTKPGQYILNIDVTYGNIDAPTLLETNLINVLPNSNYQLPKPQIKINGKTTQDVITDIVKTNPGKPLEFEADITNTPSAKIVKYIWDFGDSQTIQGSKATHTYQDNPERNQFFPILRVIDENGFFADAYVQVTTQEGSSENTSNITNPKTKSTIFTFGIGIIVLVLAMVIVKGFGTKKKH